MYNRTPSVYIPVEPENNGIFAPLFFSTLIHVLIIAFIVYTHRIPHIDPPASIETSIITQEELEAIEANIQANRNAADLNSIQSQPSAAIAPSPNGSDMDVDTNSSSNLNDSNSLNNPNSIQNNTNNNTSTTLTTDANNELSDSNIANESIDPHFDFGYDPHGYAAKEEAFRLARENFAKQLADEMEAKKRSNEQRLEQIRADRQAEVEALRRRAEESSTAADESSDKNYNEQNNNANNATNNTNRNESVSFESNHQIDTNSYGNNGRSTGNTSLASGGIDDAALKAQLERLIKSRWSPPTGSSGQRLVAIITVNDANGMVTSVSVSGAANNSALNSSLVSAIQAGPLTPLIGTGKTRIRLIFIAS